jgi:glutathionylspermidine synthase
MYGEEYALASVLPISEGFRAELKRASEALGAIFAKTAAVVMQADDELLSNLGLPEATWAAVRHSLPELLPSVIGRFDFAATPAGLKMLEFNAETPTDIVEAFYVNGKVCAAFGAVDPNAGMAAGLTEAFRRAVRCYRRQGWATDRIVFSSVDWHEEDAGTTRFLLAQPAWKPCLFRCRSCASTKTACRSGTETPTRRWTCCIGCIHWKNWRRSRISTAIPPDAMSWKSWPTVGWP